jgi:hypothetical protein
MMQPPLPAEYVEDQCDQEDRPRADGGPPPMVSLK